MSLRLPHPLVLLLGGVLVAAVLTWVLPAGRYERTEDPVTGREVVVAGTYRSMDSAPVGPFAAVLAIPRGIAEAVEVVLVVLLVGGAWVIVERVGTLGRVAGALVARLRGRAVWAVPTVSLVFGVMGGLENMQEEIIPLIPVLLILGRGLGFDAITVVAMSAGAAVVGSAFGPTNPFQAGIALQVADLAPLSLGGLRVVLFVGGLLVWILWTVRHARRNLIPIEQQEDPGVGLTRLDALVLVLIVAPFVAYVYGALALGWGFNELSAMFLVAGAAIGMLCGLGATGTTTAYLEGMKTMLPAAVLIGVARAISLVLADGRVIDTLLHGMASPLMETPRLVSALLMVPFHAIIHVAVPSVSGQAVLTMPIMAPLADLLGFSRQVAVLAYQTGAGLTDAVTPTNGALMAILLAAGVPYGRWLRFVLPGIGLVALVGIAGMMTALG